MDQQRHLEKEYAQLVTLRSELKGLNNKQRLQDIRSEILVRYFLSLPTSIESGKGTQGFDPHIVPPATGQSGR